MSGYNAEYSAPRETELEDLPATLAPIVLGQPIEYAPIQMGENVETLCEKIQSRESFTAEERQNLTNILKSQRDMIHKLRTEDISADDYRLTHIWEAAAEFADQKGYCSVFDDVMDELGTGFAREEEMVAYVAVNVTVPVYVTVRRGSDPEDYIDSSMVDEALSNYEFDVTRSDWSVDHSETTN